MKAPTTTYNLELDVIIPKDTYSVNETLEDAEYYMNLTNYDGEPFKGIILYNRSREGSGEMLSMTRGYIRAGDFNSNSLMRVALTDYFDIEGIYTYSISMYDCLTIETELGKDCDDVDQNEIEDTIQPLGSKSKSITVIA